MISVILEKLGLMASADTNVQNKESVFLIFLDIDGVLHPNQNGSLVKEPLLQGIVSKGVPLRYVLSSSWRLTNSLETLKQDLPTIADSLIGVTPEIRHGYRDEEIAAYLKKATSVLNVVGYLVVDDDLSMFRTMPANLYLTNRKIGLTPADIGAINSRIAEALKR